MHVRTYSSTSLDTYSDRHVLRLLPCAGEIALCCAVLTVQRHTHSNNTYCGTAVCCCIRAARGYLLQSKKQTAMENEDSMLQLYKMLEHIHAGSGQLCMLASVVVWYARKRTLCKARHNTAKHGTARTARHRTAPHGAAPRR